MQTLWFLLIAVAGGALLHAITKTTVLAPGRTLQTKFVGLGTLAGKTQAEIASVVGQPNALSGLPEGKTLLQWQAPGYHIALRFNGDVCEGITHQSVAR